MKLIIKFFLKFIFLCAPFFTSAQENYISIGDSLFNARLYERAFLEYEKAALYSNSDHINHLGILKGSYALKHNGDLSQAHQNLDRFNIYTLTDSFRYKVLYEMILTAYLNKDYPEAKLSILQFKTLIPDTSQWHSIAFLEILTLNELRQWTEAKQLFSEYIKRNNLPYDADKVYYFADKPRLKKQKKAEFLATFFPGMGQIYLGEVKHGLLNSFLIAATLAWGGYNIYQKYYLTGVFSGFLLGYSFYQGGINWTSQKVEERNKEIAEKYNQPIRELILEHEMNPR